MLWLLMCLSGGSAAAEELEVRLRFTWWGGDARSWVGSIAMPRGQLSQPRPLGWRADEAASIYLERGVLHVDSASSRTFDGVDLTLRGSTDAEVAIELRGREGLDSGLKLRSTLGELMQGVQARLDERGNRLEIARAPGDALRIDFTRNHLVFEPGEEFPFQLKPHWPALAAGASYTIRLRLSPARQSEELWSQQFSVTTDAAGNLAPLEPITLNMPAAEGVYDLVASVHPWQFTSAIRRSKPVLQRKVQVVVIAPRPAAAETAGQWNAAPFEIDPAHPTWWDRLPRLSLTAIWPSFAQGPISSGPVAKREHLGQNWIELPVGAWQAYPLAIGERGQPHLLEIEYPSDTPQRLGISILEPNAAGRVEPLGIDSGVVVSEESEFGEPRAVRHRLVFWPRTDSPLVLLTNRSDASPALFGKIRVLGGPRQLPPLAAGAPDEAAAAGGGRLLTAYFDKPLFAENFAAADALDEPSGRALNDWLTFYQGGRRLVEYLKHMGYTGAVISVSCEGSTLYPSKVMESTLNYDNGELFASGQDPLQKDVLEMLMRMFEREGLQLVPAMQFATPIPSLEALRRQGRADVSGLQWVDGRGVTMLEQRPPHEGLAAYYNPLHPLVRQTITDAVSEVARRYGKHESFGGIALQLGPYSYARLPGAEWGFDDATVTAYRRAVGGAAPATAGPARFSARSQLLLGDEREQWIAWRAAQMTSLYGELARAAAAHNPEARLYLADVNLLADDSIEQAVRPRLPRQQMLADIVLEQGLDLAGLQKNPQLVVMRPRRALPDASVARHAATIELNEADDIERFYAGLGVTTALNHAEPDILRLPAFDAASPYGPQNTYTRLVSQFSPSQAERRRALIKSLAESEKLNLCEGGWMLPLGQEDALRQLFATWRALPGEPFETLPAEPAHGSADGALVIRRLRQGDKTYLYLLNNAPWPATARLELSAAENTPLQGLGGRAAPALEPREGGGSRWTVHLDGYDLVAAVFSAADVQVAARGMEADPRVHEKLSELVRKTGARLKALSQVPPLELPANPSFEAPPLGDEPIPGWVFSDPLMVRLDGLEPHSGGQCLRMEHAGEIAWMRSAPLPPPTTGRIAILVWLRTAANEPPPRVRLSLDYQLAGERRYEFMAAGVGTPHPLRPGWAPYVANFDTFPTERVSDLRVGIDCMTAGAVWVDDLEVYDSRFESAERAQLTKIWALANFYLEQGRLGDCYHVLTGYWPRFLRTAIDPPREVAALEPQKPAAPAPADAAPAPANADPPQGLLDRIRRYSPARWLPFK